MLNDYMKFIRAKPNESYLIRVDIEEAKARGLREGLKKEDKRAVKLVQEIYQSLYDVPTG